MKSFTETLTLTAERVEAAVTRIKRRDEAETELHDLRARLVTLLELVEPNPGIGAAADDLFHSARAFVAARDLDGADPGRQRMLREALLRFQERLATATPNDKARQAGLL